MRLSHVVVPITTPHLPLTLPLPETKDQTPVCLSTTTSVITFPRTAAPAIFATVAFAALPRNQSKDQGPTSTGLELVPMRARRRMLKDRACYINVI